jgi:uncharacterized protein YcbX
MSERVTVADLALAPVKGMQVARVDAVRLEARGPAGDRAFLVVDAGAGGLLLTTRTPALLAVAPRWDEARRVLALRFPDGGAVEEEVVPGEAAATRLYDGRELTGRLVGGELAAAVSAHLGREVRLLLRDRGQTGADDAPVTLMSGASLRALAPALGGAVPDARRFRMTISIEGVEAWEEHGWGGRELATGDAVLRVVEPVPRCVVTTRDPEDGRTDVPTLKALARLRGKDDVTFGVWCEVVRPGVVRRGDAVAVG